MRLTGFGFLYLVGRIVECGIHFVCFWAVPRRPGKSDLARFFRLTLVCTSAGHELVSPADLPTIVS